MRKFFQEWEWEDTWFSLIWAFVATAVVLFFVMIFSVEKVVQYSLSENNGHFSIEKHVDWRANDYIQLDRSVTLEEAVREIDSLNKTINYVKH